MADRNLDILIRLQARTEEGEAARRKLKDVRDAAAELIPLQTALLGIAIPLAVVAKQGIQTEDAMRGAALAFERFAGSADSARAHVSWLADMGGKYPFPTAEILDASLALSRFGSGSLAAGDGFRMVLDTATATGKPLGQLAEILGRLKSMTESGIFDPEAIKALWTMGAISDQTHESIKTMIATGASGTAVWDTLSASLGRFAGAAERAADRPAARWQMLRNQFDAMAAKISGPVVDALVQGMGSMSASLEQVPVEKLQAMAQSLGTLLEAAAKVAGFMAEHADLVGTAAVGLAAAAAVPKVLSYADSIHKLVSALKATESVGSTAAALDKVAAASNSAAGAAEKAGTSLAASATTAITQWTVLAGLIAAAAIQLHQMYAAAEAAAAAKREEGDSQERGVEQVSKRTADLRQSGVRDQSQLDAQRAVASRNASDTSIDERERMAWKQQLQLLEQNGGELLRIGAARAAEQAAADQAGAAEKARLEAIAKLMPQAKADLEKYTAMLKKQAEEAEAARDPMERLADAMAKRKAMGDGPDLSALPADETIRGAAIVKWTAERNSLDKQISDLGKEISGEFNAKQYAKAEIEAQVEIAELRKAGRDEDADAAERRLEIEKKISELRELYPEMAEEELQRRAELLTARPDAAPATIGPGVAGQRIDLSDQLSQQGYFAGGTISATPTTFERESLQSLKAIERNTRNGSTATWGT